MIISTLVLVLIPADDTNQAKFSLQLWVAKISSLHPAVHDTVSHLRSLYSPPKQEKVSFREDDFDTSWSKSTKKLEQNIISIMAHDDQ